MKYFLKLIQTILVAAALFLTGCAISFNKEKFSLPPKADNEISVMSFNVENLFDTVHDEGKADHTYLPLAEKNKSADLQKACKDNNDSSYRQGECLSTDWSEERLNKKLTNLSTIVLDVDGNGPDVLLLVEVENKNVLDIWNKNFLQKANYQTVAILNGPDRRGINLGLMSRFPIVGQPILHNIEWAPKNDEEKKWMEGSRGIFEVTLKAPNGDPMTFFVAHFPSQSNPVHWRVQAGQTLAKLMKAKGPNAMVLAAGDFNIIPDDEKSDGLYSKVLGQAGAISHMIGCEKCPGTHNHRKKWSFLDAQIYSPALLADGSGSYKVQPETIDVIRYNELHLKRGKYPNRWDHGKGDGVSDHFPIYVRLKQRSEAKNPVKDAPAVKAPAKKKKK